MFVLSQGLSSFSCCPASGEAGGAQEACQVKPQHSANTVNMVRPHQMMHEELHSVLASAVGGPNSKSTTQKKPLSRTLTGVLH